VGAKYLVDTDILIYLQQKRPPQIRARFDALEAGDAGISVITHGELIYGAERSEQPQRSKEKIEELISFLPVWTLPEDAGAEYGRMRAELEKAGTMIGGNDLWIAAHAKAAGLVLVTNNEKEFRRLRGLQVENWAKS
jgi:tRNA(fMet)-specific endonuclease VapC